MWKGRRKKQSERANGYQEFIIYLFNFYRDPPKHTKTGELVPYQEIDMWLHAPTYIHENRKYILFSFPN